MCRIAGIVDGLRYHDQLKDDVDAMISTMIHGGPDGRGLYLNKTIAIGHCRLSFLDLSNAAAQPMHSDDSLLHISYNGEIYNFKEIREKLIAKSYIFKTNSDTEVVLQAYKEWGVEAFKKFNGMFAFALFDERKNKLFLIRDPNGIKPLYYYTNGEQLVFASETRAFKNIIDEENNFWKTLFLAYGHLPEPYTKLLDVFALPRSSYLEYDLSSNKYKIEFYKYESSNKSINDIYKELSDSVERHLISDAPIGMFLSGGIDSSILTMLASKKTNHLHTLSIYFNEAQYSEKYFQDLIAQKSNADHHSILLQKDDFINNIENILNAYDLPSNDGVNTWFISMYAKQNGLKAVLSGLGADELFGGYPSFKRLNQLKMIHKYKFIFKNISSLLPGNLKRLSFLKLDSKVANYLLLRGFYSPNKIASILNKTESEIIEQLNSYIPANAMEINSLRDISKMEVGMYMQNQLLKDSDYMSMQHGIEIRVPFLDNDFLCLISSLDESELFINPGKKELLIETFKNILPKEIYDRPKKGFQFPFKEWLKNSDVIKEKMNTSEKKKEYELFCSDKIHWSKIWALAQLN